MFFALLLGALAGFFSGKWDIGLLAAAIVFILQYLKPSSVVFCLTHLKIKDGEVFVSYYHKDELKEFTGNISEFRFKKGFTLEKTLNQYLSIYYRGERIIKQYEGDGNWTGKIFNEIIKEVK